MQLTLRATRRTPHGRFGLGARDVEDAARLRATLGDGARRIFTDEADVASRAPSPKRP